MCHNGTDSVALSNATMSAANSSPQCTLSRLQLRRSSARLGARLLLAAQIATSGVLCLADTDSAQLRPVATSGTPVPGGGTFDRFHMEGQPAITPVNDRGQVAFFATLAHARASEGMFLGDANGIEVIALSGSPLPGGGKLASFPEHPVAEQGCQYLRLNHGRSRALSARLP